MDIWLNSNPSNLGLLLSSSEYDVDRNFQSIFQCSSHLSLILLSSILLYDWYCTSYLLTYENFLLASPWLNQLVLAFYLHDISSIYSQFLYIFRSSSQAMDSSKEIAPSCSLRSISSIFPRHFILRSSTITNTSLFHFLISFFWALSFCPPHNWWYLQTGKMFTIQPSFA